MFFYLAQFHLQSLLSIRKLDTTSVKTVHGQCIAYASLEITLNRVSHFWFKPDLKSTQQKNKYLVKMWNSVCCSLIPCFFSTYMLAMFVMFVSYMLITSNFYKFWGKLLKTIMSILRIFLIKCCQPIVFCSLTQYLQPEILQQLAKIPSHQSR